jgi:hypothetical protein
VEGWDDFIRECTQPFLELKASLEITIYGSYYPDSEMELLISLKDSLIADGYTKTVIVKDRQGSNDLALDVSQRSMLFSDINLLVFTKAGKRLGLVAELTFLASDPRMVDKIPFSRVFDEGVGEDTAIPELTRDQIKLRGIPVKKFGSYNELKGDFLEQTWLLMRSWAWRHKQIP